VQLVESGPDGVQAELGTRYQLQRQIGRGGMATVYLACDTKHARQVAIKVLHPSLAGSLGADRFRQEITMLAQLQHPHILTVYDSGDTGKHLWFAMPYVEGESLRQRLTRETQLPVEEALRITRDIASALDYAHARGIIHRDIKPENVLLTQQGEALLADFGIARIVGADAVVFTDTGVAIGTPQYMSPEQANGERNLDARTDVFSLGAILYEMLVGEPPFPGPTPQVVVIKMMAGAPLSVQRVRSGVPPCVDLAVRRALAVVPVDRWASAVEFAAALGTAEARAAGLAPAAPRVRRWFTKPVVIVAGLAIAATGIVGWYAVANRQEHATGALRLAVLPFENIGDSADAYFADGVTEAVRGKLIGVPGLEVIGSTSSGQYRRTTKTPREIGSELGAQYLVEGRVRWAKAPDGTNRVRVSAELVDAGTATDKWEQPFDAPLTDVFQVQNNIAGQVAKELQLELTPTTRQTLAIKPTTDVLAYEAYLRGAAVANAGTAGAAPARRATMFFQQAVNRDSTFALAWAALANQQVAEYMNGVPTAAVADSADWNSIRALALAYNLPDAHTARADYYLGVRHDPVRAMHQDSMALVLAPGDANTLRRTATLEQTLGRWNTAEAHMSVAARLDPQSIITADEYGNLLALRGRFDQAEAVLVRAAALDSTSCTIISDRLVLHLMQGDLAGGHALLRAVPARVNRDSLVAYVAQYGDFGWALDSADAERLLNLGPEAFDGDRGAWAFALAQQYALRGDVRRMRAYADTARAQFAMQARGIPTDAMRHALLGMTLAYLGRHDEAIAEGKRAVALLPIARDAVDGPYMLHQLVRIDILVGEPERALDALEPLVRMPYVLTPGWLRIDPNFAPLGGNARFERLLSQ
jgi:TolB-like protein/tRNA A-37 threonylcarbamoyl transferase component Bud32